MPAKRSSVEQAYGWLPPAIALVAWCGPDSPFGARTPIPISTILVILIVAPAWLDRIGRGLPLGVFALGPFDLHPLVLVFVVCGSLMISKTLRIDPKTLRFRGRPPSTWRPPGQRACCCRRQIVRS